MEYKENIIVDRTQDGDKKKIPVSIYIGVILLILCAVSGVMSGCGVYLEITSPLSRGVYANSTELERFLWLFLAPGGYILGTILCVLTVFLNLIPAAIYWLVYLIVYLWKKHRAKKFQNTDRESIENP